MVSSILADNLDYYGDYFGTAMNGAQSGYTGMKLQARTIWL